ncbi:MAG: hypothetical protein NC307_09835 [Roseburia sp.]|nr:hypothetical protein [Roseburia sp.]
MKNPIVKEGLDILKKLSPKNQTYFMTMLRLAKAAEDGVKREIYNQSQKSTQNTN